MFVIFHLFFSSSFHLFARINVEIWFRSLCVETHDLRRELLSLNMASGISG